MKVVYVDTNDNIIGAGSIDNATKNDIIVRIARVFLQNSKGELLIQKRSDKIYSFPGVWDQTAAGHVDEGEDCGGTAYRELKEEMGIEGVELTGIAHHYLEEPVEDGIKKCFYTIFTGIYDGEVNIDYDEVAEYKWVATKDLRELMAAKPADFTESFIGAFNIYMSVRGQ